VVIKVCVVEVEVVVVVDIRGVSVKSSE